MRIVLWDTRKLDASKDFAGGMGIGMFPAGGGLRGRLVRYGYTRDRRPTALLYAHLAAIFKRLEHQVEYSLDEIPPGADLYVFNPSLITMHLERQAMAAALAENPGTRVLAVGTVASVLPQAFQMPGVTVVKGEAEQLLWKFDEVLSHPDAVVQLGAIEDLDRLPIPDWSLFQPEKFRISYDFWRFPTALVQASRGCTLKCNYCPYIVLENANRQRNPEAVVEEIRHGNRRYGFRSFKFRDPLFGLNKKNVFYLAELLGRMPQKIQFSIETRIDLMRPEVLRVLKRVGLTSITVGVETPNEETLRRYHRAPIKDDRQRDFVALCRSMGIRTVAGFMIGFPEDTEESIRNVVHYAKQVGPTFANFNIVTPYPGTEFYNLVKDQVADTDLSHYNVFTPVMKYQHLTPARVSALHHWCARRYYFRWQYLRENAHLLFPGLQRFGVGQVTPALPTSVAGHVAPPPPLGSLEQLPQKSFRQDTPH
jgi:tRNA A37 methylthiotransferase MiaB